jgi:MFS family permease
VYAQEALGTGPLVAGLALGALTIGWPISASQAGRVYLRVGFRGCALIGSSLVVAGVALLLLLDQRSPVYEVGAYCLVIGLGMGLTSAPTLIAAQSSVGWTERGVVTANNIFLRSLGSALGVAVFGAIANAVVGTGAVEPARLTDAVHRIFIGMLLVSVVMVVLAGLIPRSADQVTAEPATPAPDTAGPGAPSPARAELLDTQAYRKRRRRAGSS